VRASRRVGFGTWALAVQLRPKLLGGQKFWATGASARLRFARLLFSPSSQTHTQRVCRSAAALRHDVVCTFSVVTQHLGQREPPVAFCRRSSARRRDARIWLRWHDSKSKEARVSSQAKLFGTKHRQRVRNSRTLKVARRAFIASERDVPISSGYGMLARASLAIF
jgi:hypothetical protein